MPKNATLRRQRAAGGALGVLVLAFALTYHFFPRVFHVDPTQAPRRSMSLGGVSPGQTPPNARAASGDELNAGPPLTLAPAAVAAARHGAPSLPEQRSADSPDCSSPKRVTVDPIHSSGRIGPPGPPRPWNP